MCMPICVLFLCVRCAQVQKKIVMVVRRAWYLICTDVHYLLCVSVWSKQVAEADGKATSIERYKIREHGILTWIACWSCSVSVSALCIGTGTGSSAKYRCDVLRVVWIKLFKLTDSHRTGCYGTDCCWAALIDTELSETEQTDRQVQTARSG